MRFISGLLLVIGLVFMTGCGGPGDAANPLEDQNSSSGTGDPIVPDPDPVDPVDPQPQPPTPGQPNPGDLVAASTPDPNATYPALGQALRPSPDPLVEPNTDYSVPVIGITSQPAPFIAGTAGTITLGAADNVGGSGLKSIECSIDGNTWSSCSTSVSMSGLSEGLHTLEARATDWDDNVSTEVSYAFYVDQTPPVVSIAQSPAAVVGSQSASFQFAASDIGAGVSYYQCKVDTGTLGTCNSQELLAGVTEGKHRLSVRAIDGVGNRSAFVAYDWTVDLSPPIINVVKQPTPVVYIENGNTSVNFTVADIYSPTGIVTTCKLNGVAVACTSGTDLVVPTPTAMNFTLEVTSTDALGHSTMSTISWQALPETDMRSTSLNVGDIRPVDILFVVDNSGSMAFERSNLAQRISGMINIIDGLDWQIAVTSTDATSTDAKSDGNFVELIGMPGEYILDSNMDPVMAQTVFGNTVQNFGGGSGNEEGIHSSRRVIDRYVAGQATHTDFIRNGADLSVVLLSDEDESSDGSNVRTTPQQFVNLINTTFGGQKRMVFHSIIARPGDTACLNGEGAYAGNTYDALSRLTGYGQPGGAIIGSVCATDYTAQLANIGQSVKDLQNSITLDCPPHDANKDGTPEVTISYRADAGQAYVPYNAPRSYSGARVIFVDLLPPGDYKADYKCKIN